MNVAIISNILSLNSYSINYANERLERALLKFDSNLNYEITEYHTKEFWEELQQMCDNDEDWNFDKREKFGRKILERHFKQYDKVFCINKNDFEFFDIFNFNVIKLPNERDTRFAKNYEEKVFEILEKHLTNAN